MITPDERDDLLQPDDQWEQNDEQQSQQDIHSNGFDDTVDDFGEVDESDSLSRAYEAAESSYELNLDDDDTYEEEDE